MHPILQQAQELIAAIEALDTSDEIVAIVAKAHDVLASLKLTTPVAASKVGGDGPPPTP